MVLLGDLRSLQLDTPGITTTPSMPISAESVSSQSHAEVIFILRYYSLEDIVTSG